MKRACFVISLVVVLLLSLTACSKLGKGSAESVNDLTDMELNGKISTLREKVFGVKDNFGSVVKTEMEEDRIWIFNEAGYIKEEFELDPNGDLCVKVNNSYSDNSKLSSSRRLVIMGITEETIKTYQYDDKGNKTASVVARPGGDIEGRTTFVWDKKGNLLEQARYGYDGNMTEKMEWKYDNTNRDMEYVTKDKLGNISEKVTLQYTGKEKKPSTATYYGTTGAETSKHSFKWGANDELVEQKNVYSDLREEIYTYKYVWDKNNNWTQKIEYANGVPVKLIERVYNEPVPTFPVVVVDKQTAISEVPIPSVTATSFNPKYPVSNLIDGNPQTSWVAGRQGSGAGESITFVFDTATDLSKLMISPGYTKNDNTWTENNRVKDILLEFSDATSKNVSFNGNQRSYSISIDKKNISWLKLKILSTYSGSKWADTCISEVSFE